MEHIYNYPQYMRRVQKSVTMLKICKSYLEYINETLSVNEMRMFSNLTSFTFFEKTEACIHDKRIEFSVHTPNQV